MNYGLQSLGDLGHWSDVILLLRGERGSYPTSTLIWRLDIGGTLCLFDGWRDSLIKKRGERGSQSTSSLWVSSLRGYLL